MITWSRITAGDLDEICARIGRDSQRYASVFAWRVMAAVRSLERFPKLGWVVPEYDDDEIAKIRHGARPLR